MQRVCFGGVYRVERLTLQNQKYPEDKLVNVRPVSRFTLKGEEALSYGMGEWSSPKLRTAREIECLEDFIANRPRHKLGKTELFWRNGSLYAVTNDERGQDFKTYKQKIKALTRAANAKLEALRQQIQQPGQASNDAALDLMRAMTEREKAKHPYHDQLAQKAQPAQLEITRGGKEGFIVNYRFTPQQR